MGPGHPGGEGGPPGSAHLTDTCRLEGGAPGDRLLRFPRRERAGEGGSKEAIGRG